MKSQGFVPLAPVTQRGTLGGCRFLRLGREWVSGPVPVTHFLLLSQGDNDSLWTPAGDDASYSEGLLELRCILHYELVNLCISEWGLCDLRMRIFKEGRGNLKSWIWGCKSAVCDASSSWWFLVVRCIFTWFSVISTIKAAQNWFFKNGDAAFASSFLFFGIFSADWKKLHPDIGILPDFSAWGDGRKTGHLLFLCLRTVEKSW